MAALNITPTFTELQALLDGFDGTNKQTLVQIYAKLKLIKPSVFKVSAPSSNSPKKLAMFNKLVAENVKIVEALEAKKAKFQDKVFAKLDELANVNSLDLSAATSLKSHAKFIAYNQLRFSNYFVLYLETLEKSVARVGNVVNWH